MKLDIWEKISDLELDPIKFSLVHKEDGESWSLERATIVETWYRRFLFLMHKYPNKSIVPSKDIDSFWHTHILDTEKYFDDCENVFGHYLHHYPYFGVQDQNDKENLKSAFDDTNLLYEKHFGESLVKINTKSAVCTQSCSQCTHCKDVQPHEPCLQNKTYRASLRNNLSDLLKSAA
jgi:hypothetical protein